MSEVGTGDSLSEELKRLLEQTDLAQLGEITPTLDPISPGDGIDRFLERKETEIRPVTVEEYRNKLGYFQQFCEIRNLDNLNELDGRFLDEYQRWRRKDSHNQSEPLSNKTMQDDMYLLQDFIRFLEEIEAVKENLSNKIRIPTLGETEGIRDIDIAANRVEKVLGYLHSYHYASREHVVWAFHAHTGRRPGGLYALDVCDVHLDGNDPYVDINHRPDETPLKNGKEGESEVGLSGEVPQIFRDYIAQQRIDVTTDSGRRPFLTSTQGRLSKSTMRRYFYKWSRPCAIGDSCPRQDSRNVRSSSVS
jgi:site-specific recombinase XerD